MIGMQCFIKGQISIIIYMKGIHVKVTGIYDHLLIRFKRQSLGILKNVSKVCVENERSTDKYTFLH